MASDIPKALDTKELEPGFLYIVLTHVDDPAFWNFAFFISNPAIRPIGTSGTLYHIEEKPVGKWKLKVESKNIISSSLVLAILRLEEVNYCDVWLPQRQMPMYGCCEGQVPRQKRSLLML